MAYLNRITPDTVNASNDLLHSYSFPIGFQIFSVLTPGYTVVSVKIESGGRHTSIPVKG